MKVFALQMDIAWEDREANHRKVRELLERAQLTPGSLVVLPEMFSSGFSMNPEVTRESKSRPDEDFLAEIARKYQVAVMGGVVSIGDSGKRRNEAVAISPEGQMLARYAKRHPFSLVGEAEIAEAGEEIVVFPWSGLTLAPFVCYDLRFPEDFRAAARLGADVLVVMAIWPAKRVQHWLTLLQARAIENQAFVIGVNRVGDEPGYHYAGRSVVVDPMGMIVADAGEAEGVIRADLDLDVVRNWRRDFPALRDAR